MEERINQSYIKVKECIGKKRKTLRSELIHILVVTCGITFVLIGGFLSVIIFWSMTKSSFKDMQFYMQSIQNQFEENLLLLEDVVYLTDDRLLGEFFLNNKFEDYEASLALEDRMNLFSERNRVSGGFPVIKDFYIYNKQMRSIGIHYYPITNASHKSMEWHLKNELKTYLSKNVSFYYQKNGTELDCIFNIFDENLEIVGYCAAVIDLKSVTQIFQQLEKYDEYYWNLKTTDGRYVGGTGLPDDLDFENQTLAQHGFFASGNYFFSVKNNSFGLVTSIIIPKEKIYLSIISVIEKVWLISLSLFFVVLFVLLRCIRSISVPMKNLVEKMNQFATGDFGTRLDNYKIEEFQLISSSFNDMAIKTDQLIKEVYENRLIAQESKIQYLQAQINPHFMFNVLSMIAIRLKLQDQDELYHMVTSFAGLMQGKIFRKDEVEILLEKEMEIVGFYLFLQEERFKDIISYDIFWESDELKLCYIPRLTVEPLVENSVIHGLEPKGAPGHISVRICKKDEKTLNIHVEDDGIGFDADKIDLQSPDKSPRVGILNVQRLIQNLYGKEYGLSVESREGKGTHMILCLPINTKRTW